jgi:hypothetical protein
MCFEERTYSLFNQMSYVRTCHRYSLLEEHSYDQVKPFWSDVTYVRTATCTDKCIFFDK